MWVLLGMTENANLLSKMPRQRNNRDVGLKCSNRANSQPFMSYIMFNAELDIGYTYFYNQNHTWVSNAMQNL